MGPWVCSYGLKIHPKTERFHGERLHFHCCQTLQVFFSFLNESQIHTMLDY